jgi:hypothetical protein
MDPLLSPFEQRGFVLASRSMVKQIMTQSFYGCLWTRKKRPHHPYTPIRNPIYLSDGLEPLRRQAARALYVFFGDPTIAANFTHKTILLTQA